MLEERKRGDLRFKFRHLVQYEKILEDGSFSLPITAPARDISTTGMSFYAAEKMSLNSKVRISFTLDKAKLSFVGKVMRMEITENAPSGFLIGIRLENVDEETKIKISALISKINIFDVLKDIDLEDVVDINFVVGYPPILKKIGKLEITEGEPFTADVLKSLLLNILDEDRCREFMEEKEANFVFSYKEGIRFRVNLHVQQSKIEGVFRLIPSRISLPHQIGFPSVVEELIENKRGLVLVAGRTGSGKSTTLASMIEFLNSKRKGIIVCIEKPIEYIHVNKQCIIKQREVGRDTLSFSNAAKNALRQNPDVLLIGEILDVETMEVAITAAETGMLVLSSIHAADSSQALDRVISFFPAGLQRHMLSRLSLILKGIVTQNLIPRKDGKGLVVAAEILIVNDAMRSIIRAGDWKQIPTLIQTGGNLGMQSMGTSLERHFLKGTIDGEYLKEYM